MTPPNPRSSSVGKAPDPKEGPKGSAAKKEVEKVEEQKKKASPVTPPKASAPGGRARPVTPERGPAPKATARSPPPKRDAEDRQSSSSTGVTTPEVLSEKEDSKDKGRGRSRSPLLRRGFGTKQRKKFQKKYGGDRAKFEDPISREAGAPPSRESKGEKGKGKNKGKQKGKGKSKGKQTKRKGEEQREAERKRKEGQGPGSWRGPEQWKRWRQGLRGLAMEQLILLSFTQILVRWLGNAPTPLGATLRRLLHSPLGDKEERRLQPGNPYPHHTCWRRPGAAAKRSVDRLVD